MKDNAFAKITPSTVQQKVVDSLRDALIRGDLDFGEHLTETELASQMAVSRIPIREALRQLELEGLLISIPNRGSFVITVTEQDIVEILSLRTTLESMAIELSFPRLTPADIASLRDIIEEQRRAIAGSCLDDLTKLDAHFHEYICTKANNSRMLKAWYAQSAQWQMLLNRRFHVLSTYTPSTVIADHTAIVDALERADAETAITLTKSISKRVQQELIQIFEGRTVTSAR